MRRVYIHPLAGVLSAYGMGLAQVRALREEAVEKRLEDGALTDIEEKCVRLGEHAVHELAEQGVAFERLEKRVHLKYEGTDTSLAVPLRSIKQMREEFERLYRSRVSFLMPDRALVAEAVSVQAGGRSHPGPRPLVPGPPTNPPPPPLAEAQMTTRGTGHPPPLLVRERPPP